LLSSCISLEKKKSKPATSTVSPLSSLYLTIDLVKEITFFSISFFFFSSLKLEVLKETETPIFKILAKVSSLLLLTSFEIS